MGSYFESVFLIAETLWNEGNSSKSLKIEEKDKEPKREVEGGKDDRCNLKYWGKSIQELDLSDCQRCSPSYRLLPEDVRMHCVYYLTMVVITVSI